jgi:predicted SprT family Zn-dependent metalloprotease
MNNTAAAEALTAHLTVLALRALHDTYYNINQSHFRGRLQKPVLGVSDSQTKLGQWVKQHRRLELSNRLLLEHSWGTVVEILKHEMAHQYVDEVLECRDEPAHGPTFQRICAERGIDARATAAIGETKSEQPSNGPALERVSRLLALARSSNQNEAQAAMNAAQRLMLKHNLSAIDTHEQPQYGFRHLGEPTGRINESQRVLALIITEHFFVDAIWVPVWRVREGKRGSVLEVCGTGANLDMAAYVHSFLTETANRLWRENKRSKGIKSNRDRLAFIAGVMTGFYDKLNSQKKKHNQEGLVWVGDPALRRYLKIRHPYTRCAYYGTSKSNPAHVDGRIAGEHIVLHRGLRKGRSSGPKLLPA